MTTPTAEEMLKLVLDSVSSIKEKKLFKTERGYQGELLAEIHSRLKGQEWAGDPILEQECQKRLGLHGLTIRPDLIIHIPFERGNVKERKDGNFCVIELKLRASQRDIQDDLKKLSDMCNLLRYGCGIFVNIDAHRSKTTANFCDLKGPLYSIATALVGDNPVVSCDRIV